MGNELQRFLQSVGAGFQESPQSAQFKMIEPYIDEKIDEKIREIASELSGVFIERLADVLQERGLALDGHKVVEGFRK